MYIRLELNAEQKYLHYFFSLFFFFSLSFAILILSEIIHSLNLGRTKGENMANHPSQAAENYDC